MKKVPLFFLVAVLAASCKNNNEAATSSTSGQDSTLAALSWKDSMIQKNEALVLSDFKAFNAGDLDGAFKGSAQDYVDYGDGSGNPVRGLDSIKAALKAYEAAFPDNRSSNYVVVGDLHHVALFADWTGTFTNAFMGLKPTHKSYHYRDVDLFTFNDSGQITEHRGIMPFGQVLMQLGVRVK